MGWLVTWEPNKLAGEPREQLPGKYNRYRMGILVGGHRIKRVRYDLDVQEGAAGRIGPADDRGAGVWLLGNRHLLLELEDGRKMDIRTRTDGEIVVEGS